MNVNKTSVFLITYCLPKVMSYSRSVLTYNIFSVLSVICCHLFSFSHVVDYLFVLNKTNTGIDVKWYSNTGNSLLLTLWLLSHALKTTDE